MWLKQSALNHALAYGSRGSRFALATKNRHIESSYRTGIESPYRTDIKSPYRTDI